LRVINIFGGPGCGKSTMAAKIFVEMKCAGYSVELVSEFVKGLVYSGDTFDLNNSLYVMSQQDRSLQRLEGRVDWAVSDSPLPLCLLYAQKRYAGSWFQETVVNAFLHYDNVNFFLRRHWPYQSYGRYQNESEAVALDEKLRELLVTCGIRADEISSETDVLERVRNEGVPV